MKIEQTKFYMYKVILGAMFIAINSCMLSRSECVKSNRISGYQVCKNENSTQILFLDEKYLMEDVPLLGCFYLENIQELQGNNNYTVGVLAQSYKDSIFFIENDTVLLQNLSKIKDTFLFHKVTKYILDSFEAKDFVNHNFHLEENNVADYYFHNSKFTFVKFLLYCFLEKENLNLGKFRDNLLLTLLKEIEGEYKVKNNIKRKIKIRSIRMMKEIFNLIDPDYNLEELILKFKKSLKERDLK
jgi:hypothetical protein